MLIFGYLGLGVIFGDDFLYDFNLFIEHSRFGLLRSKISGLNLLQNLPQFRVYLPQKLIFELLLFLLARQKFYFVFEQLIHPEAEVAESELAEL